MSKIISLVIAFGYLITAYVLRKDGYLIFLLIAFLFFPLYLIWFGEGVGRYRFHMHVTNETPDNMVKFAGWIWLLMPIIAYVIVLLTR